MEDEMDMSDQMRGIKGFSAADLVSVLVNLQIEKRIRTAGVSRSGGRKYEPLVTH
jgi:hypothetical protein